MNRREFFKTAGIAGAAAIGLNPAEASARPSNPAADGVGVLVDIPKCIGCRRCEYACQDSAGLAPPPLETFEDKTVLAEMRRPSPTTYTTINRYPNPQDPDKPIYTKVNCLHCLDPACVSACIVGALARNPDGPVVYDAWKCIGCRYCMVACPFQIPTYEYDKPLTPQVRKCNLCAHRIPNEINVPACIKICPAEVMTYGERSTLVELAREKIGQDPDLYVDHIYGEHEVGGTSWLYISPVRFEDLDFVQLASTAPPRLTEAIQHGVFKYFIPPLALYGLLGAIMALTRSSRDRDREAPPPAQDDQGAAIQDHQAELQTVEC